MNAQDRADTGGDGPEEWPPECEHDWQVAEFGNYRSCPNCNSVVVMQAGGLTHSGWLGSSPQDANWPPLDITRLWAGDRVMAFGRSYIVEEMTFDGDRVTFTIALDGKEVE